MQFQAVLYIFLVIQLTDEHNQNMAYFFQVSGVSKLSVMSRMEVFSIYSILKFLPRPCNALSLVACEEGPCSALKDVRNFRITAG